MPFLINVCGPLPNDANAVVACRDATSGACGSVNGQNVTFGSYVNSSITAYTPRMGNATAFSLTYRGGLNNQNQTAPGAKNGTCNQLYDRETVIIFTCGESLVCSLWSW